MTCTCDVAGVDQMMRADEDGAADATRQVREHDVPLLLARFDVFLCCAMQKLFGLPVPEWTDGVNCSEQSKKYSAGRLFCFVVLISSNACCSM